MTDRPTKEEVDIALMVARPGASIGPNVACVLAAEVRALRAELEAEHAARLSAETDVEGYAHTSTALNAWHEARTIIARVSALPARWRLAWAPGETCADDLEAALRGDP